MFHNQLAPPKQRTRTHDRLTFADQWTVSTRYLVSELAPSTTRKFNLPLDYTLRRHRFNFPEFLVYSFRSTVRINSFVSTCFKFYSNSTLIFISNRSDKSTSQKRRIRAAENSDYSTFTQNILRRQIIPSHLCMYIYRTSILVAMSIVRLE